MYHNASKSAMICNDGPASDSCLLRHRCASKNVVDCDVGKSKRQAVVNEGDDANEIGEVVRADISGEFPVKGRRGPWYFSGTWDKKTRHGSVKLIRKKSEAAKHFVEFKPWFERQSGKKTKRRIVGNLFPGRCIGTIRASCAVRPNTNGALHPTWHCLPGSGFSSTPCWGHVSRSSDMESDVRFPWLSGSSGSDGSASPKRRLPDTVPCNAARPDPQLDRFFDTYLKSETSASADLETGFYRLYAERFSSLLGVPIGGVCDKTPADVPLDENADDTMVASLDRIASNEEPTGHDHNDEPDPVPAKERLESLAKRLGSTMQTPTRQARRRTLRRRDRSRAKRTDEGRSLSARPDAGMPLPAKAEGDRPVVPAVVAPASTPLQRISEVLLEYSSVPPHCLVASERRPGVVLLKEVARSSPEFTACQDLVDIGMATRASAYVCVGARRRVRAS
ncbi:hypothetical protein PBRA_001647 [Plasmodiophora brassicae]|uniref:Uncharacterized protein n=1 Tax=Plasmodiophora brassicae TaxID=37360 RepID=A0A0G4IZN7_PLABS|nr:hypothetical protein PBRA_001647 [Plasmodiophora brassicae]